MAMPTKDRRIALLESTTLNGIDFVEVASADQRTLRVHFLNNVGLSGHVSNPTITGGETIRTVSVNAIDDATDWSADAEGRPILTLSTVVAGDFSFYTLTLENAGLDSFFAQSVFSFKAACPSDLDCEATPPPCPPMQGNPPPIDYLAKDFLSFRKALLDFSALRYPEWQERSEADFGVMFLEALAGLADDLSYIQDRVAAEGTLQTATQRRSIVRLARLVDYEPRPATSARVLLQFNVTGGSIPAGLEVSGVSPNGQSIVFEAGTGLADRTNYLVSPQWNSPIQPYYWDDSQLCLKKGSTEMWVAGQGFDFSPGQALLIDTQAPVPADPPIREIAHIISSDEEEDFLFLDASSNPMKVTHIIWDASEALKYDHDLSRTVVAGNLIPATQGKRSSEAFSIDTPPPSNPGMPLAVVRTGFNSTPDSFAALYLYSLRDTPLVWLTADAQSLALPEIEVIEIPPADPPFAWAWRRNLLDAGRLETAFTLDRARFLPIAKNSDGAISYEYDGDSGDTIRFGGGDFGSPPEPGAVFHVNYRVGAGADGNLAADSITNFDVAAAPHVASVSNPFAARGGGDQESNDSVRRLAPQAFRAVQFRAVRAEDYVAAAETLDWVERAGTVFRWTGSWLSVFTTADPLGSEEITIGEQLDLIRLLNRRRLAGYESYAPSPHYVALDLEVYVCARPEAFRGDVKQAVLSALGSVGNPDGAAGFFFPDNFTFGTTLEKSSLEAAIQRAYGVAGVHSILYRRRGVIFDFVEMPDKVTVATNDILRVDNDPSRPERGSLRVYVDGGK
jgi:Baseplate J-like protein